MAIESKQYLRQMRVSSHFGNFVFFYVFGDEVTKILLNSLFIFSFYLALTLQTENIVQKIMQPKWQKTKNKVTKICDEPGIDVSKYFRDLKMTFSFFYNSL